MSSPSPSPASRPGIGKKYEAATKRQKATKEQERRADKEREISREQDVIRNGVDQRFPEGQEIPPAGVDQAEATSPSQPDYHRRLCTACPVHANPPARPAASKPASSREAGPSDAARPPSTDSHDRPSATILNASVPSPVGPQDATQEADGDSADVVAGTSVPPPREDGSPNEGQGRDTDRQPDNDTAIAEFRFQLAEQKAVCEELQRDVNEKDGEIATLRGEVRSMRKTQIATDTSPTAEWTAKYENVKRLLQDTEEEVEKLEAQLKEAKSREKTLQRQLDEARDEADRRERILRNRVVEAEDKTWRL